MAQFKDLRTEDLTRTFRKMLPFTFSKAEDKVNDPDVAGEIEGFAAGLLNIDKGEDLIFPGAFENASTDNVVVAYQHDISSLLGKPLEMAERYSPDYGLFTRSEIVNTTLGSDVMKLIRRGVLKKQSIGYRLVKDGYAMLNRETLAATLKDFQYRGQGIPPQKQTEILADYDKRELDGVFGLFKVDLREYSIVTFAMNDNAAITAAKGETFLDGLPFSTHPALVLAANRGYVKRATELFQRLRKPENRPLGEAHKEALEIIATEGATVSAEARALLAEMNALTGGVKSGASDAELEAQFLTLSAEIDARLSGNI